MTCLVTGATGFIGSRLVRRLLDEGCRVRCLVRPGPHVERLRGLPVELVEGDITDPAAVRRAVSGARRVFHNAAVIYHYRPRYLYRVNVTGTLNLLRAAAETGIERLVYSSSIAAMGPCRRSPADEDQPLTPLSYDAYGRSKRVAEQALRRFARDCGVPYTVIRMGGVYGPGSPLFSGAVRFLRHGVLPLPGKGDCGLPLGHVDDICSALLLAAGSPAARNRTYIVVDDRPVTVRELVTRFAELLGARVRVYPVSLEFVRPGVRVIEWVSALLRTSIPVSRAIVEYLVRDHRYSNERAKRELGWRPAWPDSLEGLRTVTDWCREQGMTLTGPARGPRMGR